MSNRLILSQADREVDDCADKMRAFIAYNEGMTYVRYKCRTPDDELWPEDLAVTLAFNSRASGRAFKSLDLFAGQLDLASLPDTTLAQASATQIDMVVDQIHEVSCWPGFRISLATKLLHKKRPALIPVIDNRAIIESYLDERWPQRRTTGQSWRNRDLVRSGLNQIAQDLNRPENRKTWDALRAVDPQLTQIEVLDMVWWMHFRDLEPVYPSPR